MNGFPILSVMTWAPFIAALAVMFFARRSPLLVRVISLIGATISLVASLWVYFAYDRAAAGFQFQESVALVTDMGAEDALARAWLALGRLRSAQGRQDEARQLWTKALATFERLGSLREPERVRRLIGALPASGPAGSASTSAEV